MSDESSSLFLCPHCGAFVSEFSSQCPNCGNVLEDTEVELEQNELMIEAQDVPQLQQEASELKPGILPDHEPIPQTERGDAEMSGTSTASDPGEADEYILENLKNIESAEDIVNFIDSVTDYEEDDSLLDHHEQDLKIDLKPPKEIMPERSDESDHNLSQLAYISDNLNSGESTDEDSRSTAIHAVEDMLDIGQSYDSEEDGSKDDDTIAICNSCGAFVSGSADICNVCGQSLKGNNKFVPEVESSSAEDIEAEQAESIIRSLLDIDEDIILKDEDDRFQTDGSLGLCTVCGAFISEDAESCTVCGTHINEMPEFVPSIDIKDKLTDNKELAICPHCGVFVQEGATECMSCIKPISEGAKVEMAEIEDKEYGTDKANNLLRNFLGIEKSLEIGPIRDSSMCGLDICPDCSAFVSLKAVSCSVCGNSLFDGEVPPSLATEQKMACPNCDSKIASDMSECPLCGIVFAAEDEFDLELEGAGEDITDFLEKELDASIPHLEKEVGMELSEMEIPTGSEESTASSEAAKEPIQEPEQEDVKLSDSEESKEDTPPEDDLWVDDGFEIMELERDISGILEEIELEENSGIEELVVSREETPEETEPVRSIPASEYYGDDEEAIEIEEDMSEALATTDLSESKDYKEPLEFIDDGHEHESIEFVPSSEESTSPETAGVSSLEEKEEPEDEYVEADVVEKISVDRDLSQFNTEARSQAKPANWATGIYVSAAAICFFLGFYVLVPGDYAPGLAVIFGTFLLIGTYLIFTERGTFFRGDLKRGVVFFTGIIFATGILLHWPMGIFTSEQGAFGQPGLDRLMLSASILLISVGILWIRARVRYIFTWFGGIILLFLGTVMLYTYTGWSDVATYSVLLVAGLGASLIFISLIFLQYERALNTSIESDIVRGDAHYLRQDYKGALRSYDDALTKSQIKRVEILGSSILEYDVPWYSKGSALILMGEFEEGIKCLDMALAINPNNEVTWVNKGNAHSKLGEHSVAMKCYECAIKINPFYEIAWNNMGNTMARCKEYVEALKHYNRSIKINPKYDDAWINKGYVLARMGKREQAIKCLSHVGSRAKAEFPGKEIETQTASEA